MKKKIKKIISKKKYKINFTKVPIKFIIPNLFTILALCSGLTAIKMIFENKKELSIEIICLAAILDCIDGRLARILKSTSKFGAELDSLADFVNFGVTPALMIYLWVLKSIGSLGWIISLIFSISTSLRLARFNVLNYSIDYTNNSSNYFFFGVPAPAGSLIVLLPLYLQILFNLNNNNIIYFFVSIYTIIISYLMISKIPTFSGKNVLQNINRDFVLPLILIFVIFIALLFSYPFQILTFASIIYLISIYFSIKNYKKFFKKTYN